MNYLFTMVVPMPTRVTGQIDLESTDPSAAKEEFTKKATEAFGEILALEELYPEPETIEETEEIPEARVLN